MSTVTTAMLLILIT